MLIRDQIEGMIPSEGGIYDVIVAGGGPAGLGAALAAAANGASTLLLESRSFFGGVAAVALWMPMNRVMLNGGSRGGVHDVFVRKIKSFGREAYTEGKQNYIDGDGLDIHPDYLRLAAFELLEEAGCHYRLYSPVTGVMMDGNTVKGVVTTGKDGQKEFTAKVVIDCTGDGDVAYHAGAEMVNGREEDGIHMGITLGFALANVEVDRILKFWSEGKLSQVVEEAGNEGYLLSPWHTLDITSIPGVISVNHGGTSGIASLDGTRVHDLTLSERYNAKYAVEFVRMAREKKVPGLENCHLMRVGANVGVRDTRRMIGEYVLTFEDAVNGVSFDDVVCLKYGGVDANQLYHDKMNKGYCMYPYRCLLPKRIENLLVAGRCGSATFLGHAAGKSMGNMMGLGQAAGVAAALYCKHDVTPRQLPVKEIQEVLTGMGVKLNAE